MSENNGLRAARTARGMSQQELATRVKVSIAWLRILERRSDPPSPKLVAKLERALGLESGTLWRRRAA